MTKFDDLSCARHLAEMIAFETVSNPNPDEMDFSGFYALHDWLKKTYPLVHQKLECEVVGRAALLYSWKGSGKGHKKPLLLAAHQDVVPVGEPARWKYPPFGGTIAEGRVWGRGACDCKGNIMAHMEAIEALLSEDYRPECDVYLAYGWNEEVNGSEPSSAAELCRCLQERGVRLGMVVDEGRGPGADPMEDVWDSVAYVYTCEKGYADIKFTIRDRGGHSMMPGNHSVIAELGQIAVDLMANTYPYRLTGTVTKEYLAKAAFMGEHGKLFEKLDTDFEALLPLLERNPMLACKFRTTMALTMMQGSSQANVLPTEASITMNCRLLPGDGLGDLIDKVKAIVGDRAEVELVKGVEASDESPTDCDEYRCVVATTMEMYPETTVMPSIMPGGTDAKYYSPICENIYRYSGFPSVENPCAHTYDERVCVEGISKGPEFIYRLIRNYGE